MEQQAQSIQFTNSELSKFINIFKRCYHDRRGVHLHGTQLFSWKKVAMSGISL